MSLNILSLGARMKEGTSSTTTLPIYAVTSWTSISIMEIKQITLQMLCAKLTSAN